MIFAAAARQADAKKTSNAKAVDNIGLVNCAALHREGVPILSSCRRAASRSRQRVYIFLNLAANGIMDAKIAGEDAVQIVRGAGLAEKNRVHRGPPGVCCDPGSASAPSNSTKTRSPAASTARTSRSVESLDSKAAFDTTFECYYKDTAKGLDDVMKSNAAAVGAGVKTTPTETSTGRERRGDTWPELFEGLERDRVA